MTGFVYAISGGEGRVKIGWSSDPFRRLAKLRSDCPAIAHLLGLVEATKQQEAAVHGLLAPWRIQREWFHLIGPVVSFVEMLPKPKIRIVEVGENDHPLRAWRKNKRLSMDDPAKEALERAKDAAGGFAALARKLGIKPQAVWQWDVVPPLRVLAVEQYSGVPRHELRPDLYPLATAGAAE